MSRRLAESDKSRFHAAHCDAKYEKNKQNAHRGTTIGNYRFTRHIIKERQREIETLEIKQERKMTHQSSLSVGAANDFGRIGVEVATPAGKNSRALKHTAQNCNETHPCIQSKARAGIIIINKKIHYSTARGLSHTHTFFAAIRVRLAQKRFAFSLSPRNTVDPLCYQCARDKKYIPGVMSTYAHTLDPPTHTPVAVLP